MTTATTTPTTPTTQRSAYPAPVDDLLPRAQALAESIGGVPSRNRLMKELRVGAPKATALREALAADDGKRQFQADVYRYQLTRGSLADPPDELVTPVPSTAPDEPEPVTESVPVADVIEATSLPTGDGHPDTNITAPLATPGPATMPVTMPGAVRLPRSWPVWLLAAPAFVAIWSGWVGLGELTGFGKVHPLPGIWDSVTLNTAITLPIGVETYAAYALAVWLTGRAPAAARRFARWSAIGSLIFGAAGQVAYHLLTAAGVTHAPWQITTAVSCLPVAVLGMGAALAHLIHANHTR